MASQSITTILGKAYDKGEKKIPFHRIVYANGRIWVDDRHRESRMKLYRAEKIHIDECDRIMHFVDITLDHEDLRELLKHS
jgi:alkylated DNA nucleotide flippase Atl1